MLKALTVNGAAALGKGARIGRLARGYEADVILVRTDAINTMPVIDPVATLLLHAHPDNVDTVMVAGRILKRGGRLVADMAKARRELLASAAWIEDAIRRTEVTLPTGYQAD
jgi:cytosine/adenosine deaminase-related metal-dependent hydrolase